MQAVEQVQSEPRRDQVVHSSGSITRRLIYSLALLPIVPSLSIIGVILIVEQYGSSKQFDPLRCFHLIFSALFVFAMILIWKRTIIWTLGRKWLTVLIGMIPFVQVIYGLSVVTFKSSGCMDFSMRPQILRVSQHEMSIGLWIWLSIWVWWSWEKWKMSKMKQESDNPVKSISPVAKRIIASIGSIPVMVCVFLMGIVLTESMGPDIKTRTEMLITHLLSAIAAIVIWIFIWRQVIVWSTGVKRKTYFIAFMCLFLPIMINFLLFDALFNTIYAVLINCLPVIGWGLWMAITVSTWPIRAFTATSGDASPRCMKCGYLLRGLTATRCPECGDEPTLDVLWASMVDVV